MKDDKDEQLRKHLVELLQGGNAHATFDQAIEKLPATLRAKRVGHLPYTAWMLLEHLRIAQFDILEFSRNAKHASPKWPGGYWPEEEAPPSASAWEKSVQAFHADLKAMQNLVADSNTDLYAPIAWGEGQTILREALLVADHNAYHVAELVVLRRLLGAWKS
jgi:DinB superfamily